MGERKRIRIFLNVKANANEMPVDRGITNDPRSTTTPGGQQVRMEPCIGKMTTMKRKSRAKIRSYLTAHQQIRRLAVPPESSVLSSSLAVGRHWLQRALPRNDSAA